jgi:multidrug efflux pump subunit AcrB
MSPLPRARIWLGTAVVLGGMLVSTLVTLVLVPLLLGLCFRVFPVR